MGSTWIGGRQLGQRGSDAANANEVNIDGSGGNFKLNNVSVAATAAEMDALDRDKITWFSDFLGDAIPSEMQVKAGSGTGNAVAISAGKGGRVSILTASDDGAITANASSLYLEGLDWRADQGSLAMEVRLQLDVVTTAYCFIGFTDTISTTLEAPIFLVAADIDSDASNACGVAFDADGDVKTWFHGGVKANVDTAPVYATGPTAATYTTIRVEVSAAGAVQGFVDGVAIGPAVANATTVTTALCPCIVVANRSAAAITSLVDYFWVQGAR